MPTNKHRVVVRTGIIVAASLFAAPQALAMSYGTQQVSTSGQTAYAYGSTSVMFTTAKLYTKAKVSVLNGKGGYSTATFTSPANAIRVRSGDSQSTSYKDVSNALLFAGPTYGPWKVRIKTCIDVSWASDPCSGEVAGAA